MSLSEDLYAYLAAQAGVTALTSTRIAQGDADQTFDRPYIAYRRSGREAVSAIGGEVGIAETQFELWCVGDTIDQAEDVADAVCNLLSCFRGTWGSTSIVGCFVTDERDEYQIIPPGQSSGARYATEVTLQVFSRE